MNRWHVLGLVTLLIIVAAVALFIIPSPANAPGGNGGTSTTTPEKASLDDLIVLDSPLPGAEVTSPITLTGKARGTWYFEASFPIDIVDWDGRIIVQGHAEAESNWMTAEYVPFRAVLTYTTPTPGDPAVNRGAIILRNDNPSGDPARDKALEVSVVFK